MATSLRAVLLELHVIQPDHYEILTTMAIPRFLRCSEYNLTYHPFSSRNATAGHATNHLSRSENECLAHEAKENQLHARKPQQLSFRLNSLRGTVFV